MKAFFYDDEALGAKYVEGDIPEEYLEQAKEYREKMIEAISDVDEKVMDKFLNGQDVTADEIRAALRKGAIEMKLTPVICGTAFKNKGVQHLLDAIVDYLPCPYDIPPVIGISPDDNSEQLRKPEPAAFFLLLHSRL
jgi:elongation factor G